MAQRLTDDCVCQWVKTTTEFAIQRNTTLLYWKWEKWVLVRGLWSRIFGGNEGELNIHSLEPTYHTSVCDTLDCYVRLWCSSYSSHNNSQYHTFKIWIIFCQCHMLCKLILGDCRVFFLLLTDKTLKMLFVGARKVVCVPETGASTRQHLASSILKDNYKQMFLGSQCQLQSCGTIKVPFPPRICNFYSTDFSVLNF